MSRIADTTKDATRLRFVDFSLRAWREGPASRYEYVTEVFDAKSTSEDSCVVTGRLTGNFPGGTAELSWHFTLAGDRIARLRIAP